MLCASRAPHSHTAPPRASVALPSPPTDHRTGRTDSSTRATRTRSALRIPWTGMRTLRLVAYGSPALRMRILRLATYGLPDLRPVHFAALTAARKLHRHAQTFCTHHTLHPCVAAAISPPCTRPPDAVHWLAYQRPLQRTLTALLVCRHASAAGPRKISRPADPRRAQKPDHYNGGQPQPYKDVKLAPLR